MKTAMAYEIWDVESGNLLFYGDEEKASAFVHNQLADRGRDELQGLTLLAISADGARRIIASDENPRGWSAVLRDARTRLFSR